MKTRVGLIGSDLMVERLAALSCEFPNLDMKAFPFKEENQSEEIFRNNAQDLDIVVFSGPVPYELSKPWFNEFKLPIFVLPYDESAVLAMLLHLTYHIKHDLRRLSIDLPHEEHARSVFKEAGVPIDEVYIIDYEQQFNDELLSRFHYDLWVAGKTNVALTCRINVYNQLLSQKVPCLRMVPPIKALRDTMVLVNLKSEALQMDLARLAVINVRAKSGEELFSYHHEETVVMIHQALLPYAKQIGASISEKAGYISLQTERKKLEAFTSNFTEIPFLADLKQKLGRELAIGIGIGWTNYEAEQHALIALQQANTETGDGVYVVTEDKEVFGPINSKVSFTLKTTDKDLINASRKTSLSVMTLSKIRSVWIERAQNSISSEDIAIAMDISRRSAQRLLKILVETDHARIVGEEQPYQKGRPSPLYQLRL